MGRPSISAERQLVIFEAFERCVLRLGLAATSLNDVAEEAGLPRSVVRYFVGNRDQMVTQLIDRMVERVEARLVERVSNNKEPSASALVELLFDDVLGDEKTHRIAAELWHVSLRDAQVGERLHQIYTRLVDEVAEQVSLLHADKSKTACRMLSYTLVALAMGVTNLSAFGVGRREAKRARVEALQLLA